jgi:hypothetical protein
VGVIAGDSCNTTGKDHKSTAIGESCPSPTHSQTACQYHVTTTTTCLACALNQRNCTCPRFSFKLNSFSLDDTVDIAVT